MMLLHIWWTPVTKSDANLQSCSEKWLIDMRLSWASHTIYLSRKKDGQLVYTLYIFKSRKQTGSCQWNSIITTTQSKQTHYKENARDQGLANYSKILTKNHCQFNIVIRKPLQHPRSLTQFRFQWFQIELNFESCKYMYVHYIQCTVRTCNPPSSHISK